MSGLILQAGLRVVVDDGVTDGNLRGMVLASVEGTVDDSVTFAVGCMLTTRERWVLADALLGGALTDALNAADEGDARRAHAYLENAQ